MGPRVFQWGEGQGAILRRLAPKHKGDRPMDVMPPRRLFVLANPRLHLTSKGGSRTPTYGT